MQRTSLDPFPKCLLVLFICVFLVVLGLPCWVGFSLIAESGGYSPTAVHGLLTPVASLVAEHGLLGFSSGSTWAQ